MLAISKSMNDTYMLCNEEDTYSTDSRATSSSDAVRMHVQPSSSMGKIYWISHAMTVLKLKPNSDQYQ